MTAPAHTGLTYGEYLRPPRLHEDEADESFARTFAEALTQAQARLYRVPIAELERVTALDFQLRARAVAWLERTDTAEVGEITSWNDVGR